MPPLALRQLVGPTEDAFFDNPSGARVFTDLPPHADEFVFDFGCGCGRVARQLMQQAVPPRGYLGIDIHRGMIQWCTRELAPHAAQFRFAHHDVFNVSLNPEGSRALVGFPLADRSVSLMIAWSVFTHVSEAQAEHYLREAARVLRPDGVLMSTWFLFEKRDFPMMQTFQNALFINDIDPTNAVIFDRSWFLRTLADAGLRLARVVPPALRGYQWQMFLEPRRVGAVDVEIPVDLAVFGTLPPPLMPKDAERLGLGASPTREPEVI